jgi:AcrR family transcriptional regulator
VTGTRLLPRAERRRSILAGAPRAFASGGFDATSMEDIAEAAGVTKLIVYRHFESKEELYRTILVSVSERLREQVSLGLGHGLAAFTLRPFLKVARDDPDGFRLLWQHSAREPRFASYADGVRRASVAFARERLTRVVQDPLVLEWAAPMAVGFVVEAVLTWLEQGRPEDDERFVGVATASLEALVRAWARRG